LRNKVSINRNWLLPEVSPTSLCELSEREVTSPSNLKEVGALYNYSLVFVIFINFFGQLKDWVGQVPVLFLVSCPKGQVEKYVNVEAWTANKIADLVLDNNFSVCTCNWLVKKRKKTLLGEAISGDRIKPSMVITFLAHLAKSKVSICHHLASVVCRRLTFHILIFSSETS
jgi:hypothetical protein